MRLSVLVLESCFPFFRVFLAILIPPWKPFGKMFELPD